MHLVLHPKSNVAAVKPIPVVTGINGAVQGVKVVKFCVDDHAETEPLLPAEHEERTSHS